MSTVALQESLYRHDQLMDKLHRGRGDKEKRVRGELSDLSGIPESYLFRLQHKRRDMRDIAGEAYRRLKLAYEQVCEGLENTASRLEGEAQRIEEHNASFARNSAAGEGVGAPPQGKEEEG